MQRSLERSERVRTEWDADGVHDLRVALRRCRTMAESLSEVTPDSGWRKVKKSTRALFRAMGELRDTQVERAWVKRLAPPRAAGRAHLLRALGRREKQERESARKALNEFELKDWKKLSRKLARKAALFPLESVVFQRLAVAKIEEAANLLAGARKSGSGVAWHRARIGLKHFRYVAENFLPRRFAPFAAEVKRLQDLLGEVHDLDVLRAELRRSASRLDDAARAAWKEKIAAERKVRLAEVIAKTSGGGSVIPAWRSGFQIAHALTSPPVLNRRSA
jgi:CHAD domain-containing protein